MSSLSHPSAPAQICPSNIAQSPSELTFGDSSAILADFPDNEPGDYRPGWDDYFPGPTLADQAWWTGNRLGDHAIDSDPPAEWDAEAKTAFREGWSAGLKDFRHAAHEQELEIAERAERFAELDPQSHWNEAEVVRAVGCIQAAEGGR